MRCFCKVPASGKLTPHDERIPLGLVVVHLHTNDSRSTGEKSGLVITDDAPPSNGGGVSPGLGIRCELMLDRE